MKKILGLFFVTLILSALFSAVSLWATCFKTTSSSCQDVEKTGEQILVEKNDLFATLGTACAKKLIMENVSLPEKTKLYFLPRSKIKTTIAEALKIYADSQGASEVRIFDGCQLFPVFQDKYSEKRAASGEMLVTIRTGTPISLTGDIRIPYPIQQQRIAKLRDGVRVHIVDLEGDLKAHVTKMKKAFPEAKIELSLVSEYLLNIQPN